MNINLIDPMRYFIILFIGLILRLDVRAQTVYSISGIVKNTKDEPLQAATVFVAGSEKATVTDAQGSFRFTGLHPGNYLLVVNMLGYNSVKQAITIKDHIETLNLALADKEIVLNEVVIGAKKQSPKDLKRFTKFFLGGRYDTKLCTILNPEIINFGHTDSTLTATTDDFLVIENEILGYRVKYLLKSFFCKNLRSSYLFDGDFTFEPLTGTVEQQQLWDRNRKIAYEGSMMHFLRALYREATRKEGFLVYRSTTNKHTNIERNPSDPQRFVKRIDSNTIGVNIDSTVMVIYDKSKAAQADVTRDKNTKKYFSVYSLPQNCTLYKLTAKIDSRGSVSDRTFIHYYGYWGEFGVANQLPFEYIPD
jgi:hypothetical protein